MAIRKFLAIVLLMTSTVASAQKFSLHGLLADTLGNALPAATVLLLNPVDSSLVNFCVANSQGSFEFKNLNHAAYLFKVTYMGHRPYIKMIQPPSGSDLDLGRIILEPVVKELDAVEIAADRSPVTIKKDTIEFNAASFKTKQNAMVEDLLKKLPGVEVDNDGRIKAQGEDVQRVTVDGKNFFGTDPKLATRNLPADAVDKVQVFDKKSDQAVFTGIDDGRREKTINLELKEDRRHALFGSMMAGMGSDDRFQGMVSLNKFSKSRQLSFLGMGNNTNEPGFSMDEYLNFTGASRQMMSGGVGRIQIRNDNPNGVPLNFETANGIMDTYAGGVNVDNQFSPKTEVNGSYFYNFLRHSRHQQTIRENYLKDGDFTFRGDNRENNTNSNHRANVTIDHKIDSANTLRFTASFSLNETDSGQASESENSAPDGSVVSESERRYSSSGLSSGLNANLLYRHRFGKKGRSFSTGLQLGVRNNETNGILDATNNFYGDPAGATAQTLKQTSDQLTGYTSYGASVSFTEPLGKRKYLEANYNFRQNINDVNKEVFDISNGEAVFDPNLSNKYNSTYQYHRAGLDFRIAHSDYNFVAGTSFQQTFLEGDLERLGTQTARAYKNVLPSVRFNYDFSNSKHLRIDYETSVEEPDIQQLQPLVDNSDPLNIYVGNPDLRPAYSQRWRLNFLSFNPVNFISFFAFTDVDYTSNAITDGQTVDERLIRSVKPVNVDRKVSVSTDVNVGIPIQKIRSRFTVNGNFRDASTTALLNDQENEIAQQTAGGSLIYNYAYKEILDLSLSARLSQQQTRYEFDQPDQTFLNSSYTAEANLSFLKSYSFSANFDYKVYENRTQNFDQRIPLLNLSFSRFFLKNKGGELKFSVNNLLDKALGVDQTATINYIERVTTNSLGRYFMISFTYALNKQLNPMAMRRGGAMMRIRR